MKINKDTKVLWDASETARGIRVSLVARQNHFKLGADLFFDTIEEVKKCCKGEIRFTKRKIVTSKKTVISE